MFSVDLGPWERRTHDGSNDSFYELFTDSVKSYDGLAIVFIVAAARTWAARLASPAAVTTAVLVIPSIAFDKTLIRLLISELETERRGRAPRPSRVALVASDSKR